MNDAAAFKFASKLRSVLCDKTGEEGWARVSLLDVLGCCPDECDDAEAAGDAVLEQGYEPHHFLDDERTEDDAA